MKKLVALSLAATLLLPTTSFAEEKEKVQGSGPNPYVECGIGAALFPTVSWAAVTSNAIWDLGSTAITSALSSPETCNAKKVKTAKLILETMPELEKDLAAGEGEYLTALVQTAGCDATAEAQISTDLRASYSEVVSQADYADQPKLERAQAMFSMTRDAMASIPSCHAIL